MNLADINDFADKLDEEMAWRKHELAILKLAVDSAQDKMADTNLRAATAMLYAHWEGFVKNAASYYLQHVSQQKILYSALKKNFLALKVSSDLRKFQETSNNSIHTKIVERIIDEYKEISDIPYKGKINTKGNLNSDRFVEIMKTIGLDYSAYELDFHLIDSKLLNMRNQIAHGQELKAISLDVSAFNELYNKITSILDTFKEQLLNAAQNKEYLM